MKDPKKTRPDFRSEVGSKKRLCRTNQGTCKAELEYTKKRIQAIRIKEYAKKFKVKKKAEGKCLSKEPINKNGGGQLGCGVKKCQVTVKTISP